MNKNRQPFETEKHDLSGYASVDFKSRLNFSSFSSLLTGYNEEHFSPVALRMFIQEGKPIVTLYALDKTKKQSNGKFEMKKFKMRLALEEVLSLIKRFDFTVSDGKYDWDRMVVENR